MSTYYKGYHIEDDGYMWVRGPRKTTFPVEYDATELYDDSDPKVNVAFAKKVIDGWVKDGNAATGKISNVRKVGDKYTYLLDKYNYGIYDPKTEEYAVFTEKPTLEYIKNFSLDNAMAGFDEFYQRRCSTDSVNNPDDSLKFVIQAKAKMETVKPKMPKIGYKMPTQSQLNRGFRR